MRILVLIGLFLMSHYTIGQDLHLSQFYNAPLVSNPALTGKYNATLRFVANQRQQWRSVTVPFNTFGFSVETNEISFMRNFSAGLSILNDRAGDSRLNTFIANISGAYNLKMNPDSSSNVRLALQTGFTQKRFDLNALQFDEQFNGLAYDPSLPNLENFDRNSLGFTNLNLGIDFDHVYYSRHRFSVGVATFNLLSPKFNFFDDSPSQLEERLNLLGYYQREFHDDWDVILSSQVMWQGAYKEQLVGVQFKRIWHDTKVLKRAGYIGGYMRAKDSAHLLLGLDYDDWRFGVTYDFNYSSLTNASRSRGGLELSVIYLMDVFKQNLKAHRACPDFI